MSEQDFKVEKMDKMVVGGWWLVDGHSCIVTILESYKSCRAQLARMGMGSKEEVRQNWLKKSG